MKAFRKQVDKFWELFFREEKQLRTLLDDHHEEEAKQRMDNLLQECVDECTFWLKKGEQGRYCFILSPQGDKLIYLYYHYMIEKAPKILWRIWDFYDTMPKEEAIPIVKFKGKIVSCADIYVYPKIVKKSVTLDVYGEAFVGMHKGDQSEMMKKALYACIGELYSMYLIREIRFLKRKKDGGIPLHTLSDEIDGMMKKENGILGLHEVYFAYTILPRKNAFYLRFDGYSGVTSQLELINEMVRYEDTHVRKAENYGIIVGFLFYEHSHIDKEKRLLCREDLDEAINHICKEKGCAENIGACNGLFYTYLDYVVYDWDMFLTDVMPLLEDVDTQLFGFQPMILREHPLYLADNRPKGVS